MGRERPKKNWTDEELAADILKRFPTDAAGLVELYRRGNAKRHFVCKCGNPYIAEGHSKRAVKCYCNRLHFITANTFLHNIRAPIAWLAAIIFLEEGVAVSANRLAKLIGCSQDTMRNIFLKIATVLAEEIKNFADTILVPTSEFVEIFVRRTLETARREPGRSEEDFVADLIAEKPEEYSELEQAMLEQDGFAEINQVSEGAEGGELDNTCTGPEYLMELEQFAGFEDVLDPQYLTVYKHLTDEPQSIDTLCAITNLPVQTILSALTFIEMNGLLRIDHGQRFARKMNAPLARNFAANRTKQKFDISEKARISVLSACEFLKKIHKGIGRKSSELYLALQWFITHQIGQQTECLLDVCLQFGQIRNEEVNAFIAMPIVKVAAQSAS